VLAHRRLHSWRLAFATRLAWLVRAFTVLFTICDGSFSGRWRTAGQGVPLPQHPFGLFPSPGGTPGISLALQGRELLDDAGSEQAEEGHADLVLLQQVGEGTSQVVLAGRIVLPPPLPEE